MTDRTSSRGDPDPAPLVLHATAVAFETRGLLLLGPSGSGKSALALALMALGAGLIADDRVALRVHGRHLIAHRPATLPRLIEARHIGLLHADGPDQAPLMLACDLGAGEDQRMPPARSITFLGIDLPLLRIAGLPHGPQALRQYILHGRAHPAAPNPEPAP